MTTYERVLGVLEDGEWHHQRDLVAVSCYPAEWVTELFRSGLVDIMALPGDVQVRLRPTS